MKMSHVNIAKSELELKVDQAPQRSVSLPLQLGAHCRLTHLGLCHRLSRLL